MGILHLLDEECALQKGSDETLATKLREKHSKHDYFDAPKREQLCFTVKHYAGDVTYLCTGFREKNKDALHPDITGVMQSSSLEFVSGLFADPAGAAGGAAAAPSAASAATPGKRKKGKGGKGGKSTDRMTVASQFMLQLTSLMRTINETDVHYVRCIKPNTSNKPAIFEMSHSALQLRCAGVLEAVRISRMAYPNRMPHAAFVRRYHLLASTKWQNDHPSAVSTARQAAPGDAAALSICDKLLQDVVEDSTRYQLGRTKVFFRAFLLEALESRRSAALAVSAVVLQKHMRGALGSQRYKRMRSSAIHLQKVQRYTSQQKAYKKQRQGIIRIQSLSRGITTRRLAKQLRAAVRVQSGLRALIARKKVLLKRRNMRATTIQSVARKKSKRKQFKKMQSATLQLQSNQRMAQQRRVYRRELNEKKEEAKLSNQLAKLQARLQAEMEAREQAEKEQTKLKADMAAGKVPPQAAAAAAQAAVAAPSAGAAAASAPSADKASQDNSFWGKANKFFSGFQAAASTEETAAMLAAVSKDRQKLSERLADESAWRKRLEAEKRELEGKLRLGGLHSDVNSRKGRDATVALARKKEELAEMKAMLQQQSIEIANLQSTNNTKDRQIHELAKKISSYDDSFYALEARNVRDRTRFEEMEKAKKSAEEERSTYRLMLEQAHERGLKERQELRRDAQEKLHKSANRNRDKKQRIAELEKELKERSQVEEEKNAYKEQCAALMEQCSSLMEQLREAHGGGEVMMPPPPPPPPPQQGGAAGGGRKSITSPDGAKGSFMDRVRSGMRSARENLQQPHDARPDA